MISTAVCAVLVAGMYTAISALKKSAAASDHHVQSQVQQARVIDYISRDLRRAYKVTVDSAVGVERLTLVIPNYYDAGGKPIEPVIDGSGVRYGGGETTISYELTGGSFFRTVNGASTELASGLEKFVIDYTDDGQQAVTVGITFVPRYQYGDAEASGVRAGTATFATTLLRNKRQ